ncbi:MAG: 30S ribosomal protein S20 [Clostridia bacterium]|nr:30S ribosomal protein S20 [Clostridia bacterium]MBQ5837754.1 30S ribosomal protein S20 [Clostridia bacterium]
MPNIKSAKKRVKVTETKTLQNKMFKSAMKTSIKKYKAAVAEGNKELAEKTYLEAVGMVDRAVSKGIIHKNNAARKKSQYTKLLNGIA